MDDLVGLIAETLYDHRNFSSFTTQHYENDEYECCARAIATAVNDYYRTKVNVKINRVIFEIEDLVTLFSD